MELTPLTARAELAKAYRLATSRLVRGTRACDVILGFQGGQIPARVHWRPAEGIWVYHDATQADNRFWCCYGTEEPVSGRNLSIDIEVNAPYAGVNRRAQGVYLRDAAGRLYLGHSGRPGGGRRGIGRQGFREFCRGADWRQVRWPDRTVTEVLVIGSLGAARFPAQVAQFVYEVARFKKAVASGEFSPSQRRDGFSPEFAGRRRAYELKEPIESLCDHGLVTNTLARALEEMGIAHGNDALRDLHVPAAGAMRVLFEVKTNLDRGSIYQGVGQLMLHGAAQARSPLRVLVVPGRPSAKTRRALRAIGVTSLEYGWYRGKPVFPGLRRVVGGLTE